MKNLGAVLLVHLVLYVLVSGGLGALLIKIS